MLGWFISLSSISLIPIGAVYQIAKARGPMSRVSVVRSPTHATAKGTYRGKAACFSGFTLGA